MRMPIACRGVLRQAPAGLAPNAPSFSMMRGHQVIAHILSPFLRWLDRRIDAWAQPARADLPRALALTAKNGAAAPKTTAPIASFRFEDGVLSFDPVRLSPVRSPRRSALVRLLGLPYLRGFQCR